MSARGILIAVALAVMPLPALTDVRDMTTPEEWASLMSADLGFRNGTLLRDDYRARGDGYVSARAAHYSNMHARIVASGASAARAASVQEMFASQIDSVLAHARAAEDGVFGLLDPDGDGAVNAAEGLVALAAIARHADIDGDGWLDRGEQRLAEAALAEGYNISDWAVRDAVLMRLERNGGFLD